MPLLEKDCRGVSPTDLIDQTLPNRERGDMILVSWQNILQSLSLYSLGHELGHVVKYATDQMPASLQAKLTCLNQRHINIDPDPKHFEDEDFPDLFGHRVIHILKTEDHVHPYCPLVELAYKMNTSEFLTLKQSSKDEHSSFLFRMLSAADGDLTPACLTLVRKVGSDSFTQPCW